VRQERFYPARSTRQYPNGSGSGGGTVFYSQLREDQFQVLVHGARAHTQNFGDFLVRFAIGEPQKNMGLPVGEAQLFLEQGFAGRRLVMFSEAVAWEIPTFSFSMIFTSPVIFIECEISQY
jgi:hypothetical protein